MIEYSIAHTGIFVIRIPNDVELRKENYQVDKMDRYINIYPYDRNDLYVLSFGYNEISEQISEKYKCNLYYAPSNKLDYNFLNNNEEDS